MKIKGMRFLNVVLPRWGTCSKLPGTRRIQNVLAANVSADIIHHDSRANRTAATERCETGRGDGCDSAREERSTETCSAGLSHTRDAGTPGSGDAAQRGWAHSGCRMSSVLSGAELEGILKPSGPQALLRVGLATRFISALEVWGAGRSACHKCKGGKESMERAEGGAALVFSHGPEEGWSRRNQEGVRGGGGPDSEGTAQPS